MSTRFLVRGGLALLALLAVRAGPARADALDPNLDLTPQESDLGGIGLLQIPTARIGEEGDFRAYASFVTPYHRFGISGTVLPWAEINFRVTQITNVPYGPASFSGSQSYRDRALDARFRLYQEDQYLPDITLGLSDVAGTGLFDSEYLVATRRFYDWDVTLGLGWGELASNNMFRNPFSLLGNWFANRRPQGQAGSLRTDYFSGPSMSLFGGVEWHTPIDGLSVQAEYDPDDYRHDPFDEFRSIRPSAPVDAALVYRPVPWATLSGGIERGNTAMLKLGLMTNLGHPSSPAYRSPDEPPRVTPKPPPIPPAPGAAGPAPPAADLAELAGVARRRGWRVVALATEDGVRKADLVALRAMPEAEAAEDVGQIARAVGRAGTPAEALELTVVEGSGLRRLSLDPHALEIAVALSGRTAELVEAAEQAAPLQPAPPAARGAGLDRAIADAIFADLRKIGFTGESFAIEGRTAVLRFSQDSYRVPARAIGAAARVALAHVPSEVVELSFGLVQDGVEIMRVTLPRDQLADVMAGTASPAELLHYARFDGGEPAGPAAVGDEESYPDFSWRLHPGLKTQLNGPNGFFLYDFYAGIAGEARLVPGLTLDGEVGASLFSNFSNLTLPSNSLLPHVRSDIADYLRDGRYGLTRLEADSLHELAPDLYGRVSAGLLEEMFGGVDAEILYRPYEERWAIGLDLNHLWQRSFHERFDFRAYQVTTGQLEAYYRLPWYGLVATVRTGRYLAGDWGGTIDISREFDSGVKIGAFATFTNVSAQQFGEGRFDKGFYISVPLDLLLPVPSRSEFGYTYRPVTRDGGQLLDIEKPLWDETGGADPGHMQKGWGEIDD